MGILFVYIVTILHINTFSKMRSFQTRQINRGNICMRYGGVARF